MKVIGITGGIACGKSTVTNQLKNRGLYIVDADEIAHKVMQPNQPAFNEVVKMFGEWILKDGVIDRKVLGKIIFENPEQRQILDSIVHPYIKREMSEEIYYAKSDVVILDVPLLIEKGWHIYCDVVWVIYVDKETQIERLMKRNNFTKEEAISRIESQMPLTEKLRYAKVVIDNNGSLEDTIDQVNKEISKVLGD
jgi:dephospho-CoA kinase